ncbi:MAG: hypothetical protein ACFFDN_21930 [Candidatus Hodarchaeota archaeon]
MKIIINFLILMFVSYIVLAQQQKEQKISIDKIIPKNEQQKMGIHKLNDKEKEALTNHILNLTMTAYEKGKKESNVTYLQPNVPIGKIYSDVGEGHWIRENIDNGTYIILEDGSLWEIDPLERIDASLWLPISNIIVIESSNGSPGFDYLLINSDDGEKAHAKYIGSK